MITIQLDECANSKKLQRRCREEGKSTVLRFPRELRNWSFKDPDMLKWFSKRGAPLLTTDGVLPTKHADDIPDSHSGIIVVRSEARHTLRQRDIDSVLSKFKGRVAGWEHLAVDDLIVELWESRVCLSRISKGEKVMEIVLDYEDPAFERTLLKELARGVGDSSSTDTTSEFPRPDLPR